MSQYVGVLAREFNLPPAAVERTVALLDEGNTVPFITRYRKDQTGGCDEEQVRRIQEEVFRCRQLAERRQTILKTIEAQGKLTDELRRQIESAPTIKRLEDLYLPYRPKKQSHATLARQRGLGPLAEAILTGEIPAQEFDARLQAAVNPEQKLSSSAEVLLGVGYILAEIYGDRADIRSRIRKLLWQHGRLCSTRVTPDSKEEGLKETVARMAGSTFLPQSAEKKPVQLQLFLEAQAEPQPVTETASVSAEAAENASEGNKEPVAAQESSSTETESGEPESSKKETSVPTEPSSGETQSSEQASPTEKMQLDHSTEAVVAEPPAEPVAAPAAEAAPSDKNEKRTKKEKKKKNDPLEEAFRDYFDFQESLSRIPHHRVLAINRGEREKILRVRVAADLEEMIKVAEEVLVPPGHPQDEVLKGAAKNALVRIILPSLEREIRRELAEKAEAHAVQVFARNLRNLLLQPPVRGRRILAIDPGFRSGCKIAALDEFGRLLAHGVMHIVGKPARLEKGRKMVSDLVHAHKLNVIAIGNGTASRQSEELIGDMLQKELSDVDVAYVSVNEAGASVYSTSQLGRDELPELDPIIRSAVSIGRRLLDPLSELVKINPANIGVGMYQHDLKAKNLRESLDTVVRSCVNFVGVDVNTASPSLLRYVSGLNSQSAKNLYQYRVEHGPFTCRADLLEAPGIGEATFVQAAGFLKIRGGANPLDATWIHPESYPIAEQVLDRCGLKVEELATPVVEEEPPEEKPVIAEAPAASEEETPSAEIAADQAAEAPAEEVSPLAPEQPSAATSEALPQAENPPPAEPAAEKSLAPPVPIPAKIKWSAQVAEKAAKVDVAALSQELDVGHRLLDDILAALVRPDRDPREDLPAPIFRKGVMKFDDLTPGMELTGTVLNVVDFGAFVDVGLSDSGLVHISRLADHFIRDPHEVVSVGDTLRVWVVEVDPQRRRVSLTAIEPGKEKPAEPRRERRPRQKSDRPQRPQGKQQGAGNQPAGAGKPATGGRPPRSGKKPQRKPFKQQVQKPRVPLPPITEEMKKGKEPMRTFGDLAQFFKEKQKEGKKE